MPTEAETAAAAAAAAASAAKPWYDGVDAETIGHWDNKGWKKEDAKEIALAATKQAREAEKHFGVPLDQLLKMPKADAKPEDIKAFWGKLGAPAEAKEYDFSTVKINGQPIDDALATTLRDAMAQSFMPKDKAATITAALAKYLESKQTSDATVRDAGIAEEKATLAKNWGDKFSINHLQATEGARRLGLRLDPKDLSPESLADKAAVVNIENSIGYARTMDIFRRIGANTREDTFVERGVTGGGSPTTREGAAARKAELMADPGWADRFLKGGAAEGREMLQLNTMIDGEAA